MAQDDEISRLRKEVAEFEAEVHVLAATRAASAAAEAEWTIRMRDGALSLETTERKLKNSEERCTGLSADIDQLQLELSDAREAHAVASSDGAQQRAQATALKTQLAQAATKSASALASLESELEEARTEVAAVESQRMEITKLRVALDAAVSERDAARAYSAEVAERFAAESDEAHKRAESAELEADELAMKLDERSVALSALQAQLASMGSQLRSSPERRQADTVTARNVSQGTLSNDEEAAELARAAKLASEALDAEVVAAKEAVKAFEQRAGDAERSVLQMTTELNELRSQLRGVEGARLTQVAELDTQLEELRRELVGARASAGSFAIDMSLDTSFEATERLPGQVIKRVTNLTKLLTCERISSNAKLYLVIVHLILLFSIIHCLGGGSESSHVVSR